MSLKLSIVSLSSTGQKTQLSGPLSCPGMVFSGWKQSPPPLTSCLALQDLPQELCEEQCLPAVPVAR